MDSLLHLLNHIRGVNYLTKSCINLFSYIWWVSHVFVQKVSHRRYLHFCLSGGGVLWVWEFDISEVPRECIKTNIRSEIFPKNFSSIDNFWLKLMETQNCTIYEHGLFWCILMIRFAWLVKFYGILVAMHQQRNTQRLTGRNTQRLNWQFGKLQNLLQWERAQGHLPELIFWPFIVTQIIIEPRQGGIKCGNRGTGFLDSEGSHR